MIKLTGEVVGNSRNTLKGNNTFGDDMDNIISTVCGIPEKIDRFISVTSHTSRYVGAVGDIVVGRIRELTGTRWKVDIGAYQDGIILLSNVTLPGMLRKRERMDELQMRSLFSEGDIIVCEVQKIFYSGTISLHTRNTEKHGKMNEGFLVRVPPFLIPHTNKHFFHLQLNPGVRIVTGVNGFLWVDSSTDDQNYADMAMAKNAISLLAREGQTVDIESIEKIMSAAKKNDISPYEMLSEKFEVLFQRSCEKDQSQSMTS